MYARFKDNIWAADLAEMRYLSSKNRTVKYSLRVTNVLTKYAQVKPLRDKKGETITKGFLKIINRSNRKPNKFWVDQRRQFHKKVMQKQLDVNYTFIYLTNNEGNPGAAKTYKKDS